MDQTQSMPTERFLMLLNKADRTPEEETELQAELVRQAKVNQPAVSDTPATPEAQPETEQPAQEPVVETQPETPAQPEVTAEPEPMTEQAGYTLDQLSKELQDAIDFLHTQHRTLATEMGAASLEQAKYWIYRASKGE